MILSITEEWSGRTGGDDINESRHIRRFRVIFDSADAPENRPLIALYGGTDPEGHAVPSGFSAHEFNPWLIVVRRSYTALSPCVFDFEIEYSNRPNRSDSDSVAEAFANPLAQPWEVEWFTWSYSSRIDIDVDGRQICNVNREIPDPCLQEEFKCRGVRIRRAQQQWFDVWADDYPGAVNSDPFWGRAPETALCSSIDARRMRQGWFFYWDVSFEILFNSLGWDIVLRHEGFKIKIPNPDGSYRFDLAKTDPADDGTEKGVYSPEPVLLDKFGYRLSEDAPLFDKITFKTKKRLPFSALGLG